LKLGAGAVLRRMPYFLKTSVFYCSLWLRTLLMIEFGIFCCLEIDERRGDFLSFYR